MCGLNGAQPSVWVDKLASRRQTKSPGRLFGRPGLFSQDLEKVLLGGDGVDGLEDAGDDLVGIAFRVRAGDLPGSPCSRS